MIYAYHTYILVLLPMLGSQRYPEIFDSGRLWLLNLANIRRPYHYRCPRSPFGPGTRAQQEAQPWNFEALPFYDRTNASYGRTAGLGCAAMAKTQTWWYFRDLGHVVSEGIRGVCHSWDNMRLHCRKRNNIVWQHLCVLYTLWSISVNSTPSFQHIGLV